MLLQKMAFTIASPRHTIQGQLTVLCKSHRVNDPQQSHVKAAYNSSQLSHLPFIQSLSFTGSLVLTQRALACLRLSVSSYACSSWVSPLALVHFPRSSRGIDLLERRPGLVWDAFSICSSPHHQKRQDEYCWLFWMQDYFTLPRAST